MHGPTVAPYLVRRGPILIRLVFSNEKACFSSVESFPCFNSISAIINTLVIHFLMEEETAREKTDHLPRLRKLSHTSNHTASQVLAYRLL